MKKIYLSTWILLFSLLANADVRLPSILCDNMVLQQKSEVTLWGWCNATENITIKLSWDTTTYKTIGSRNAKWLVKIKTIEAGGPYTITIKGNNEITIKNVMLGEVWVCSGQSNMEWPGAMALKQMPDAATNATNTKIRFFYIPRTTAEYPQDNCAGSWKVCNPDDMKQFSAIGYFFGKKLQEELDVPIGLINSNWGGTPAEVWTPGELVDNDVSLHQASLQSRPTPWWPIAPGMTYNAMIAPLTHYEISGVIWYQGEGNTRAAQSYTQLFTTMIRAWRQAWEKEFPFYFVQIAPYDYGNNFNCPMLREAQSNSTFLPKTGMVVISDLVDDIKNIHPVDKFHVAERLANLALAETYHHPSGPYQFPQYESMKTENDKIRISFKNVDGGLMASGKDLTDFWIAGDDRVFKKATAKIEGNTVVVQNKEIRAPVAVRFGFTNTSMPDLFSKKGLPVNLFRTDGWDNTTVKME